MNKILLITLTLGGVLASCQNDKTDADTAAPVINMTPSNHQVYDLGDTAFIHIDFSDNDQLKEIEFMLESVGGEDFINIHEFPGTKTYSIDTFFIMDDMLNPQVNFSVKAIDPAGNNAAKEGHIHIR